MSDTKRGKLAVGDKFTNKLLPANRGVLKHKNPDGSWTIEVSSTWEITRTELEIGDDWERDEP